MSGNKLHRAQSRAVIAVAGPDARALLQGVISNDVEKVSPHRAIYAALLTPQGKYLHDFFVAEVAGALAIECEAARRDDLLRRLLRHKLRSNVSVAPADHGVHLIFGGAAQVPFGLPHEPGAARVFAGGAAFVDPRLTAAGVRAILPVGAEPALSALKLDPGSVADYDAFRLSLGLPDGSRDLEIEKTILLEAGIDQLNGVDWQKGCYMGQELTARTRYRGLIKKRLVPVQIEGPAPPPGTSVNAGTSEAGIMRSTCGQLGIALLRVEALSGSPQFQAGAATLTPFIPAWMKLQE